MKGNHKDYVKEITIKNLFGYYTYKIPIDKADIHSQLMILYGDNGSGKTTILEIIYHLLSFSPLIYENIEWFSQLKFEEITLVLNSKHTIKIRKRNIKDTDFEILIEHENKVIQKFTSHQEDDREHKLFKHIQQLSIIAFYLSDDRKFFSNENYEKNRIFNEHTSTINISNIDWGGAINISNINSKNTQYNYKENKPNDILLTLAIQNIGDWIEKKALQGSRQGEINTNAIYKEIVKRITKSNDREYNQLKINEIKKELTNITKESNEYAKYGLMSALELEDIIGAVINVQDAKLEVLYNVIEPYIKGLRANLDSLKEVQELILAFTENINSYLNHKEITYHLSSGFKIIHKGSQEEIPLTALSSGERQLLLLICNVITASEEATIFIIDEPEISLNVKWQRNLLDTLLEFGKNRNIQFIIATHSIELLTGHSDSVVKLINHKPQIQQGNAR